MEMYTITQSKSWIDKVLKTNTFKTQPVCVWLRVRVALGHLTKAIQLTSPPQANKGQLEWGCGVNASLPFPRRVVKGKISCELVETSVSFIVQPMSPLI